MNIENLPSPFNNWRVTRYNSIQGEQSISLMPIDAWAFYPTAWLEATSYSSVPLSLAVFFETHIGHVSASFLAHASSGRIGRNTVKNNGSELVFRMSLTDDPILENTIQYHKLTIIGGFFYQYILGLRGDTTEAENDLFANFDSIHPDKIFKCRERDLLQYVALGAIENSPNAERRSNNKDTVEILECEKLLDSKDIELTSWLRLALVAVPNILKRISSLPPNSLEHQRGVFVGRALLRAFFITLRRFHEIQPSMTMPMMLVAKGMNQLYWEDFSSINREKNLNDAANIFDSPLVCHERDASVHRALTRISLSAYDHTIDLGNDVAVLADKCEGDTKKLRDWIGVLEARANALSDIAQDAPQYWNEVLAICDAIELLFEWIPNSHLDNGTIQQSIKDYGANFVLQRIAQLAILGVSNTEVERIVGLRDPHNYVRKRTVFATFFFISKIHDP